jgi:hypothetical protein
VSLDTCTRDTSNSMRRERIDIESTNYTAKKGTAGPFAEILDVVAIF